MKTITASKFLYKMILPVLLGMILTLDSCIVLQPSPGPPQGRGPDAQGPPPWAPAHGYRAKTRYVFFPTIGIYYDLNQKIYSYYEGGKWLTVNALPSKFAHHDLKKLKQEELSEKMNPESHHRGRQGSGGNPDKQDKSPGNSGNAPGKKGPPSDKGKPQGKPK